MNHTHYSDPHNMSGLWFGMHVMAVNATTPELQNAFDHYISKIAAMFKCIKCRDHFLKFMENKVLKDYRKIYRPNGVFIGYFQWTWELHNAVNKYLNKPIVPLDEAFDYYSSNDVGICEDCKDSKDHKDSKDSKRTSEFKGFPKASIKLESSHKISVNNSEIIKMI